MPTSRARASTTTDERGEAEQRGREADRQPLLGGRRRCAGAAARARARRRAAAVRPAEAVESRPLAPKHAHGAPARPAASAATCAAVAAERNSAAARAAAVLPVATSTPSASSAAITPPHAAFIAPRRLEAVRRERSPRGRTAGRFQSRGSDQHEPQDRDRPQPRPLTAAKVTALSEKAAQVGAPPSSETHHVQVFWTFDDPGSTQYGTIAGCLPFLSVIRATFVLKLGALTQISSVCPTRNLRCLLDQRRDHARRRLLDLARPSASST